MSAYKSLQVPLNLILIDERLACQLSNAEILLAQNGRKHLEIWLSLLEKKNTLHFSSFKKNYFMHLLHRLVRPVNSLEIDKIYSFEPH